MGNIATIAMKDLRVLVRDRIGLFWALLFPLVYALFFGTFMGGSSVSGGANVQSALRVALIDLDRSAESRAFVQRLNDSGAIRTLETYKQGDDDLPMTRDKARDFVARGALVAYLVIPEGYAASAVPWEQGDKPEIEIGVDPSRQAESGMLQGIVMESVFRGLGDLFTSPDAMRSAMSDARQSIDGATDLSPVEKTALTSLFGAVDSLYDMMDNAGASMTPDAVSFEPATVRIEPVTRQEGRRPRGFEVSFPQAVSWALIGCASGFAMTLVQERQQGTFMRLLLAPQRTEQVLAGKALACFIACAGSASILLAIGWLVFGVRIANFPGLVVSVGAMGACFVGLMMFICTLGRTQGAVAGASWGILLFAAMLGGGMIPLFVMPGWLQDVAVISPVRWSIVAMEGAIWRGLTFAELAPAWIVLLAIGAAGFSAGVAVLRRATA